ncbi:MAG: C40 family peptidase [Methanosarcinales archaeon]|nr:C40 family peptidase [Methanosarcinales archaeon]
MKNILILVITFYFLPIFSQENNSVNIDTSLLNLVIDFGKTYEGKQYQYGSCSSLNKGFDCSGFIYYIHKMAGIMLPRSSREMALQGKTIDLINLQKGDLLFFNTLGNQKVSHVGIIYSVNTKKIIMLHVSSSKGVQLVDIVSSNYWYSRFLFGKRILF